MAAAPTCSVEPERVRGAIAYNGEIYNDEDLRRELQSAGVRFRTGCDTETLLHVLSRWGPDAVSRLRGMFAFAYVDVQARTLTLARDPLGIKPLYYWVGPTREGGGVQVVFASEPGPIVAHPDVGAEPDLVTASAYLTTIRTVLGDRTMFAGVRTVLPGEVITFDLSDGPKGGGVERVRHGIPALSDTETGDEATCRMVIDSVRRHLRSDVPTCALLSGGLDSSIICAVCRELGVPHLRTYSSGHDDGGEESDLRYAELVAARLGTVHTAAPVSREMFGRRWPEMIARMGVPLSTPNEVAINEVARRLRADGQVVTLSGEGADELFAGYELPMSQAWEFEQRQVERGDRGPAERAKAAGAFQLRSNAWISPEVKGVVLRPEVWRGLEQDSELHAWYAEQFAACSAETRPSEFLQVHLNFHRRVNLAGLLQRLDTATMLEGVEGRTPLADVRMAAFAEALPMSEKFVAGADGGTKIALRRAFATRLPEAVVRRPKASFPLPFQSWLGDHAAVLKRSALARMLFSDSAVESVCAEPGKTWNLAWPMINLALWGDRYWSD
jgi:asparagine synthase (glutamine-hydrolysing)